MAHDVSELLDTNFGSGPVYWQGRCCLEMC